MPNCPRCRAFVDGRSAYCAACGRSRITESLRVPVVQPNWQRKGLQALIVVASLWLLVTVGVAFLREAKAVRVARTLLASEKPQEAWALLSPFLMDHPQHRQALFLCGKATIRLGLRNEAKLCLTALGERSPELAEELGKDYRQILTAQTRAQKVCQDASSFAQILAWAEELGPSYVASVFEGLDSIAQTCHAEHDGAALFIAVLAQRNLAGKMVEKGYVPAISSALAQARYYDAYDLAQEAVALVPEGEMAIKKVMDRERRKVSATVDSIRQLSDQLKADARYRTGNSWCFPAAAPPAVQSARDGWGRTLLYSPLYPDDTQRCYQGFTLTSFGGDGGETEDGGQTPAAEIVCSFFYGSESWQLPLQYWISNDR